MQEWSIRVHWSRGRAEVLRRWVPESRHRVMVQRAEGARVRQVATQVGMWRAMCGSAACETEE